jgi:hypothetical protein
MVNGTGHATFRRAKCGRRLPGPAFTGIAPGAKAPLPASAADGNHNTEFYCHGLGETVLNCGGLSGITGVARAFPPSSARIRISAVPAELAICRNIRILTAPLSRCPLSRRRPHRTAQLLTSLFPHK